ncbi:MAG: type II/IV secretion system protein [Phycisphaerales bacterium]|nr:type II/IV secretion system protein [Phycisphaerales bacterium]
MAESVQDKSEMQLDPSLVSDGFARLIPGEFARDHLILSQGVDGEGREILYVDDAIGKALLVHNVAVRLGRAADVREAPGEALADAITHYCEKLAAKTGQSSDSDEYDAEEFGELSEADIADAIASQDRDLLSTAGRAPVVKLVNAVLFEALNRHASDVHFQPLEDHLLVRYRVDGLLADARKLPRKLLDAVVSRVKVMCHMDIAERRLPQDGRATVTIGPRLVDLRVSSLPTAYGERVVIRLLDKGQNIFELEKLGMESEIQRRFAKACERANGIVLVTGPTGSGKTTTLYSILRQLNTTERNVMTLEDPIEYNLPGISQSQVNVKKGVTFATGLRHILRQDPDVIMVGEIRDEETARIAIQSSLTGHLVLSTMHTNDAVSAVSRLVDLGIEPYLVNASLASVLAQRLVRRLCGKACPHRVRGEAPRECPICAGSGFSGRVGVFELLLIDDKMREQVSDGAPITELRAAAMQGGMQTLRECGQALVQQGITTQMEVDRVTLLDEAVLDHTELPAVMIQSERPAGDDQDRSEKVGDR